MNHARLEYQRRFRTQIKNERRRAIETQTPSPSEQRREWWAGQPWTTKSCVLCGHPTYVLHHAAYPPPRREPFVLVPLCPAHHILFEFTLWPWLRQWLTREQATLFYLVHSERLLRLRTPEASPQTRLF